MGKTAYLYLRASSSKQDKSVNQQRVACTAYAKANHIQIVDEYMDDGISAYSGKERPGFTDLLKRCKANPVDYVLLWDINRFSRRYNEGMVELLLLERAGVKLMDTVSGLYDSNDLGGAVKQLLGLWGSEDYSRKLSAAVKRGLDEMKEAGYCSGPAPYGYVREQTGQGTIWKPGPAEAVAVITRMYEMFDNGMTYATIAQTLNKEGVKPPRAAYWSAFIIKYILRNEGYGGFHGGKKARITTFIDPDLYLRVHNRSKSRPHHRVLGCRKKPLTGLVFCGKCGSPAHVKSGTETRRRYGCKAKRHGMCDSMDFIYLDSIEQAVLEFWRELAKKEGAENIAKKAIQKEYALAKKNKKNVQHLLAKIEELNDAEARLLDLAMSATLTPMITERLGKIVAEREQIQAEIAEANPNLEPIPMDKAVAVVIEIMNRFDNIANLAEYVDRVTIVGRKQAKIQMFGAAKTVDLR